MALGEWKVMFVVVALIGVLAFAWPSAALFVRLPSDERFSELYVLGPEHNATDYPSNVAENQSYLVILGVGNHMGGSAYYEVVVKFRNSTESLPDDKSGVASSLPGLYAYRVFLSDGDVWEESLNFSLLNVGFSGNVSFVGSIDINGVVSSVNEVVSWDNASSGCFFQIFAELWMYNVTTNGFGFDSRYVGLWLNVTAPV